MAIWDLGRFAQTLYDFDVLPGINSFKVLLGQSTTPTNFFATGDIAKMGQILVVGGDRPEDVVVAAMLEQRGYSIKSVTVAQATPAVIDAADLAILCFGLPEADQRNFLQAARQAESWRSPSWTLFDFQSPTPALRQLWGAVDDVVMGGVSSSRLQFNRDSASFTGMVSTDNNGGFASIRTKNFGSPWDVSAYDGFRLHIQGDGQRYKFLARCSATWDGVGYSYAFDTSAGAWQTIDIPFATLTPVFRARTVPDRGPFKQQQLYALQLMLSKFEYDGQLNPNFRTGLFNLAIARMGVYGGSAFPRVIVLSSQTALQEQLQETQLPYCLIHCPDGFSPSIMTNVMQTIGDRQRTNQIMAC